MKGHDTIREKLLDLAYGELSRREARTVERHLEACQACRAELSRIRETRAAMSALPPEPAPEAGERILLAAAREAAERVRERRRARLLPAWAWASSIGALAVVAVVAVSLRLAPAGLDRREDPEALLGRSPPASAAPAEAPSLAAPRIEGVAPPAGRETAVAKRAAPEVRQAPADRRAAVEEAPAAIAAAPAPPAPRAAAKVAPARDAEEGYAVAERAAEPASLAAPRSRAEASGAAAERRASAPAAAGGLAADPVDAWERLDAAGLLGRSVRRFDGCPEEQVREIDRDRSGRVVRLATLRDSSGWVEQFYGPDGALAAVRFGQGEARRTVRLGPGAPRPREALPPGMVPLAAAVSEEAAPRCE